MSLRWVAILLVAAAGLSGCANKRAIPGLTTPTWAAATPAPLPKPPLPTVPARAGIPALPVNPFDRYTLDAGDRVRVTVFGQDNLSHAYSVDSAGYIAMPLVGGLRARDLTTFQLSSAIAANLRAKYIKDPKVTVEIESYRPFFILGEVAAPLGLCAVKLDVGPASAEPLPRHQRQVLHLADADIAEAGDVFRLHEQVIGRLDLAPFAVSGAFPAHRLVPMDLTRYVVHVRSSRRWRPSMVCAAP